MKICKFIEGSFMPSYDGASQKFEHITKVLSAITNLFVIHCYRGWSDLKTIEKQKFKTFAIPPKYYYNDYSILDTIISLLKPDVIEMNDPELLVSTGLHLNRKFKIPLVYDAHFVSSVLVNNITKNKTASLPERILEKKIGKIISGATCFTEIDKINLINSTNLKYSDIKVVPFGANFKEIKYRKITKIDKEILFLGNMFFQPNQEAVEMIVNRIAPIVLKKNSKLVFKFVGDVPKNIASKYQSTNIVFKGRIENYNEIFNNVYVCLAPLRVGGGVRVKILTYTASGIPVISTKEAALGIEYINQIHIAETPEEFAEIILDIFDHPLKYSEKSKLAYKFARENHSWTTIAQMNLNFYKKIIKKPVYSSLTPKPIDKEPYWLEETIKKGRFKNKQDCKDMIFILGKGKTEKININEFEQKFSLI